MNLDVDFLNNNQLQEIKWNSMEFSNIAKLNNSKFFLTNYSNIESNDFSVKQFFLG